MKNLTNIEELREKIKKHARDAYKHLQNATAVLKDFNYDIVGDHWILEVSMFCINIRCSEKYGEYDGLLEFKTILNELKRIGLKISDKEANGSKEKPYLYASAWDENSYVWVYVYQYNTDKCDFTVKTKRKSIETIMAEGFCKDFLEEKYVEA